MNKVVSLSLCLFLFRCYSPEWNEYKTFHSLNTDQAVYESRFFENDSMSYDTFDIEVIAGDFLRTYRYESNTGEKMKILEYYQPYRTDEGGDSVLKRNFLNYDLIGDSIRYKEETEWPIGETRYFNINEESFKVLKQPRWIFTKAEEPNLMEFYSEDFGLILSLSKTKRTRLKEWDGSPEGENFHALIMAVEQDESFFNMENK